MLGTLKNAALNMLGRIPLIKKLVPQKYHKNAPDFSSKTRPELESFHKQTLDRNWPAMHDRAYHPNSAQDWSSSPEQKSTDTKFKTNKAINIHGREAIKQELELTEHKTINKYSKLLDSIDEHINRINQNPNSPINFKREGSKDSAENIIQSNAIEAFKTTIADFHINLDRIKYSTGNEISAESYNKLAKLYTDLIKQYINNSIKFTLELNDEILNKTIHLDNNVSDNEVAQAFGANRRISQAVSQEALNALEESFESSLPAFAIDTSKGPISIPDYIKHELKDHIQTLYLASNFGIHSEKLTNLFKQKINKLDDNNLYNSCRELANLKKAIHGSLLLNLEEINFKELKIGELDPKILELALQKLLTTITEEFRLDSKTTEKSQELKTLQNNKLELAQLLTDCADIELNTKNIIHEIKSDIHWTRVNLEPEATSQEIQDRYSELHDTHARLGATHNETILGRTYKGQNLIDTLRLDEIDTTVMREHFERLVLEVSLVALVDVLDTYAGNKSQNQEFTQHKNFNSVPWLQEFYQKKVKEYQSWIETSNITELRVRSLAKELARLGNKLHGISGSSNKLFEFDDLCSPQRYNISRAGNDMLKRAAQLTHIGVTALHLELFSNLFAYLRPGQENGLDDQEVKQIKDIIEFLRRESTLIDKDGKQVIAPKEGPDGRNEIGMEKNRHMKNIIGSRGFLLLNTPIIVKFLDQSLRYDSQKGESNENQSIEQRNSILASLLFYIVVKYLPETSSDIDSLKARALMFKTLVYLASKDDKYVPILHNKMMKQAFGTQDDLQTTHMDNKPGVFLGLSQDLENKLKEYPKQLNEFHAALQEGDSQTAARLRPKIALQDLLKVYRDIEEFSNSFPETLKDIEAKLQSAKGLQGHLLTGMDEIVRTTIESDTATVVNFVKNTGDKDLIIFTHQLLIDKAAKLAKLILSNNIDDQGNLLIFDSHQNTVHSLIELMIYTKQAAYLINQYGADKIQIRAQDEEIQLKNNLIKLNELFNRKVVLITDHNKRELEEYKGQSSSKKVLISLIKEPEFGFKPAIQNRFDWNDIHSIKSKLQAAKEAEYQLIRR